MKGMATPGADGRARRRQGRRLRPPVPRPDDRPPRGAVEMVEALLKQPGAAFDPVLYQFVTDVSNEQTAEIKRMDPLRNAFSATRASTSKPGYANAGEAISQPRQARIAAAPGGLLRPRQPGRPAAAQGAQGASRRAPRRAPATPAADGVEFSERSPLLSFAQTDMAFDGDLHVRRQLPRLQRLSPRRRRPADATSARSSARAGRATCRSSATCCSCRSSRAAAASTAACRASARTSAPSASAACASSTSATSRARARSARSRPAAAPTPIRWSRARGRRPHPRLQFGHRRACARARSWPAASATSRATTAPRCSASTSSRSRVANPAAARIIDSPARVRRPKPGASPACGKGGEHGDDTQETSVTDQCHDITVFPTRKLAAGACSGNGIIFDISDPLQAKRIDAVERPGLRLLAFGDLQQ